VFPCDCDRSLRGPRRRAGQTANPGPESYLSRNVDWASGLGESRDVHVATIGDDGEKAMETAMQAAGRLRAAGIEATARSIVSALPDSDPLVELGTKLGAGLVVMGAFARSRIRELFSGSLTRALVAGSPTPIYLQH